MMQSSGTDKSAGEGGNKTMRIRPVVLATACVPWRADDSLDEDVFGREIAYLRAVGFDNLYIFGTAGEGYAVTDSQFKQIAGEFYALAGGGPGICQLGVIAMSVPQVRQRIEVGLEIGYRSFQVSLPPWGALNDRELHTFFDEILGRYRHATFLHYNVSRGLRRIRPQEYGKIASDHPNLVATKIGGTTPAEDLALMRHAPQLCHFFTEFNFVHACLFGDCGLLASFSSIKPPFTLRLFEAGCRKNLAELTRLSGDLGRLYDIVLAVLRQGQHMDGAYDKMFLKAAIPEYPLRLLPPYQGSTDEEFENLLIQVRRQLPQWA